MCKRFTKFINIDDKLCNFIYNSEDLKNNSKKIKELLLQNSILQEEVPAE
jgi:hypothetical protein